MIELSYNSVAPFGFSQKLKMIVLPDSSMHPTIAQLPESTTGHFADITNYPFKEPALHLGENLLQAVRKLLELGPSEGQCQRSRFKYQIPPHYYSALPKDYQKRKCK